MTKLILLAGLYLAGALDLTPANWEAETAGKTVLIKFFAPWCGHCKTMKPAWDKLMKNWNKGERVKTSLIADVDCTGDAKPICDEVGVKGFPTLKWGEAGNLEDYDGGRDYDALKAFAKENLKPICSPANIDLCNDDKKKEIAELNALDVAVLEAKVEEKKKIIKDTEEKFEADLKALQDTYQQLQDGKDATIKEIKASGLGLMSAVLSNKLKGQKDEL